MRYLIKEVKYDKNWKAVTTITETTLEDLNTIAHYFDENAFGTQWNELTLLEANENEMLFFLQKINH